MFEYCSRNVASISTTLGNFLSNSIKWTDESGNLHTIETINNWDRFKIAERYINEYYAPIEFGGKYNDIGGIKNKELFLKEIAIKVDELIPRRYFIKYCAFNNVYNTSDGTKLKDKFISKNNHSFTKDLIYKFDINNINSNTDLSEKHNINYKTKYQASDKQIRYLESLAKDSHFTVAKPLYLMDIQEASDLISFFKGDIDDNPECLFKYFQYE